MKKAFIIVPSFVLCVMTITYFVGYIIVEIFDLPRSLGFPILIKIIGVILLIVDAVLASWLFKYRNPKDVIMST